MRPDVLRQALSDEMDLIAETIGEVDDALASFGEREPATVEVAGVALFLANLYMGVENILVRICEGLGTELPQGPSWHADLFDMFCHAQDHGLPEIIDVELADEIGGYRKFRHVTFHGYGVGLLWDRMRPGAEKAGDVFDRFFIGLSEYLADLRDLAERQQQRQEGSDS
jgi:hypothetical protein